jgi:hypothetical protein
MLKSEELAHQFCVSGIACLSVLFSRTIFELYEEIVEPTDKFYGA